jgi:hypothetical protein
MGGGGVYVTGVLTIVVGVGKFPKKFPKKFIKYLKVPKSS